MRDIEAVDGSVIAGLRGDIVRAANGGRFVRVDPAVMTRLVSIVEGLAGAVYPILPLDTVNGTDCAVCGADMNWEDGEHDPECAYAAACEMMGIEAKT